MVKKINKNDMKIAKSPKFAEAAGAGHLEARNIQATLSKAPRCGHVKSVWEAQFFQGEDQYVQRCYPYLISLSLTFSANDYSCDCRDRSGIAMSKPFIGGGCPAGDRRLLQAEGKARPPAKEAQEEANAKGCKQSAE